MTTAIHAAEKAIRAHRLAWGHPSKGKAKRAASKAGRRLSRALSRIVD